MAAIARGLFFGVLCGTLVGLFVARVSAPHVELGFGPLIGYVCLMVGAVGGGFVGLTIGTGKQVAELRAELEAMKVRFDDILKASDELAEALKSIPSPVVNVPAGSIRLGKPSSITEAVVEAGNDKE